MCIGYNICRFKRYRQQDATFSITFSFVNFFNSFFAIFTSLHLVTTIFYLYAHILYPLIYTRYFIVLGT